MIYIVSYAVDPVYFLAIVDEFLFFAQAKNKSLKSRAAQLERQIKVLIDDSVTLLKARIAELGMAAANPEDLLNRAKVRKLFLSFGWEVTLIT